MTMITARAFNRDVSAAKRAAVASPVVITDRGEPAFVLMSIDDFRAREGSGVDLVSRLSMDDDLDLEFPRVDLKLRVPEW